MPKFNVLSRADAFVDYIAEVEAESPTQAVEIAVSGVSNIAWRKHGIVEFDARHIVALDHKGEEIEETARGDFT